MENGKIKKPKEMGSDTIFVQYSFSNGTLIRDIK